MIPELQTYSVHEHLQRILHLVPRVGTISVPLEQAQGCTSAQSVSSTIDLPPWDNSSMDGFAIRHTDTVHTSDDSPTTLTVTDELAAGSAHDPRLAPGEAISIMTGAPLPTDATAIVSLEETLDWDPSLPTAGAVTPKTIRLSSPVSEGQFIRRRGEDVLTGDSVLEAGEHLAGHHLGAIAAVGVHKIRVSARPRVVVISTGDELVKPGETPSRGQIPDANSYVVAAKVRAAGGDVVLKQKVNDDPETLAELLRSTASKSDAVILTGGASVGAHDVSRAVLVPDSPGGVLENTQRPEHLRSRDRVDSSDPTVRFVRVKMQPGKPQGFGLLPDGRPAWVLPGNPVSVLVSMLLFVKPGLASMQGRSHPVPVWRPVTVAKGWTPVVGRDQFLPVRLVSGMCEREQVAPAQARGSASHLAARMATADGLVHVPAETTVVSPGETVNYIPLGLR